MHLQDKKEWRHEPGPDKPRHQVNSLQAFANIANISIATLRRLIASGEGPVVTRLSERRIGIRDDHGQAWLGGRALARGSKP